MLKITDKTKCCGCGVCASVCPQKCITMKSDEEGFLYPEIDESKCVNCNLCEKLCPVLNSREDELAVPQVFACYNKNEAEQKTSSSGGVFVLLAKHVISKGGVVYGAALKDAYTVVHKRIEYESEIELLKTSKYLQSKTFEIFSSVKNDLDNKILVLFSGTGCQIEALKQYLQKEYDNLITQDIICHGVPSPKVWKKYMLENGVLPTMTVNFRNKENGWQKYQILVKNNGDEVLKSPHRQDVYMKSFLSDCNIRPSCYECKFKKLKREVDLTLADFWGVQQVHEDMFSQNGTSAVFIHSKKGKKLFDEILANLVIKEVDFDDVVNFNPSYTKSAKKHKNREKFFKNLNKKKLSVLVKKYIEPSIIQKIARKIKTKLKTIIQKTHK